MSNQPDSPGKRLRQLLDRNGLMLKEFASLCNCTPATISRIVNDKYPISPKLLERFSEILNVSKDYILCQSDTLDIEKQYISQEFLDISKQNHRIANTTEYLRALNFSITEKIIFNDIEFIRSKNLIFYSTASQEDLSSLNLVSEYDEQTLVEIIKVSPIMPVHVVDISYQNIFKRVSYMEYIQLVNNLCLFVKNHILTNIDQTRFLPTQLPHLDKAIEQHAEEIAQGTWQPPTEEEQHQKLLRALYGDNIPDNLKKED